MENLTVALSCVTPMFLTLCLGMCVRIFHVVPESVIRHLSPLAFRALLPFVMFYSVYTSDPSSALHPKLALYLPLWTVAWFLLAWVYFRFREPDPRRRGAFIQSAFRSNIAVVGVSLAQSMMGSSGAALMAVSLSILVPLFNILAVVTLETCRGGKIDLREAVKNILTNPLIIGCLLGFACMLLKIRLPEPVEKAVSNIGTAGSVMTLLALGASFEFGEVGKNAGALVRCVGIRLILAPLAALAGGWLIGLRGDDLGIILVCMGSPVASTAYPMAMVMDSDWELTGQAVVISSMLCCFTLFLWIFLLKQAGLV